jgi:hypothetical protein
MKNDLTEDKEKLKQGMHEDKEMKDLSLILQ